MEASGDVTDSRSGAPYDAVLFDLDNTLSDFGSAQGEAFPALLREFGVDCSDQQMGSYLDSFTHGSESLWRMLERGQTTLETLNVDRFIRFVEVADLDLEPESLASAYLRLLSTSGQLIDGAPEVLDALAGRLRLGLITNGYSEVQRPRLEHFGLRAYFDPIVVSSEVGVAKPSAEFFAMALAGVGDPDPARVLVVGDSLTSDIGGGAAAGTATCWFDPIGRKVAAGAPRIDHRVSRLAQLVPILLRTVR